MAGIARFSLVALDCPDPGALAAFYARLTGLAVAERGDDAEDDWVELHNPHGPTLAFQRVDDYRPPVWPGSQRPQQLHLDFDVPDLDAGERAVLAAGATRAEHQPGTTFRVFLDPVGHPFCLVLAH